GESNLEAKLLPLIDTQTDPSFAPYAKEGEVSLRISTKAKDEQEAKLVIDQAVEQVKALVGEYLYAEKDIPLEVEIARLLELYNFTLATAESCSGGLFAELIAKVPGTSSQFFGGVVTYTNEMKHRLLQ